MIHATFADGVPASISNPTGTTFTKWPSGFRVFVRTPTLPAGSTKFLGNGEFTLETGDYVVRVTMPDDHIVASTGTLLNADQVLTETQQQRLEESKTAETPIFIVTPEEAKANESSKPAGTHGRRSGLSAHTGSRCQRPNTAPPALRGDGADL